MKNLMNKIAKIIKKILLKYNKRLIIKLFHWLIRILKKIQTYLLIIKNNKKNKFKKMTYKKKVMI